MTIQPTYEDYVVDTEMLEKYTRYQARYAGNMRENDKVLLKMVGNLIERYKPNKNQVRLLDVGCSTGNLLKHLRNAFPDLIFTGSDLAETFVKGCQNDPELDDIGFEVQDILNLPQDKKYDIIIANAVAVYFDEAEYCRTAQSVANALSDTGTYLAFEWLHPFDQDLQIIEKSRSHPNGLKIHFRPFEFVNNAFVSAGFSKVRFHPFEIPIDLARDERHGDNEDGFEDLNSFTVRTESSKRIIFRGVLSQPWCHMEATKAA